MIFEGLPNAPSTAHGARLRATLLRRSCDGVAATTELRRPAPSRSFCASRLDATRRMKPAFISSRVDLKFNGRGPRPTVLGDPPGPVYCDTI